MLRRQFIKNSLIATGAFSFPWFHQNALTNCIVADQSITAGFKKSIMWGTVGLKGSVLEICKEIKKAGFQGIEPNSHMDRKEVIDAVKSTGLGISDVCCSTHWNKPLSHPDTAVRQEGIEGAIVALEDAHAYGSDAILLVPGVVNNLIAYDDCWNRSIESINKLIPIAEKLKVQICVENVWNNFLLSPVEANHYVDQFNSPFVKFYLDCGNLLVYGWPEQWIKILNQRIGRIHIKEFSRKIAEQKGKGAGFDVLLTEGDVDWVKVMEAIRIHYKNVWLTTEQGSNKTFEEIKDLSTRFDKALSM